MQSVKFMKPKCGMKLDPAVIRQKDLMIKGLKGLTSSGVLLDSDLTMSVSFLRKFSAIKSVII